MIDLIWAPHLSLGPFIIGGSLDAAKKIISFSKSESLHIDFLGIESYSAFDGRLRIEARGDVIESVSSECEFMFNGNNLIGMRVSDVERMLQTEADEVDSTESKDDPVIVDFDGFGLQLVVNDGVITSATCY